MKITWRLNKFPSGKRQSRQRREAREEGNSVGTVECNDDYSPAYSGICCCWLLSALIIMEREGRLWLRHFLVIGVCDLFLFYFIFALDASNPLRIPRLKDITNKGSNSYSRLRIYVVSNTNNNSDKFHLNLIWIIIMSYQINIFIKSVNII